MAGARGRVPHRDAVAVGAAPAEDGSGRVVGAEGHQISIWREPKRDESLYSVEPFWDIDRLFEVMPSTLGAAGWELPPFHSS